MPKDDGQDKLSEATGIPRKELDGIWRDVKDNHKRLADCSGPHEFEPDPTDRRPILKRHVCKKCGGWVDAIHAHWYTHGLEHGRKEQSNG